jgi:putative aminopeptidase FrvX
MDLKLLKRLCETPGAPGREDLVRRIVSERLTPVCDEVSSDALGNVVGTRRGHEPSPGGGHKLKLMLSSHMDEISFMVSFIGDDGFIRFTPLGGFDAKTLTAQRVIIHGKEDILGVMGSKPIHIMTEKERRAAPRLEDYFVDVGLPAARVRELVSVGDVITRERDVVEIGETVNGKAFDNRMGVFVLLEAMGRLGRHQVDVYAVASTQEEVGLRGAAVAARNIDPDIGIALDITIANDVPEAKPHEQITRLGSGTAIKVMDQSVICNHKIVAFLRRLAEEHEIPYQLEVLPRGGTDTAALQRSGKGAAAGCLSIPTRYTHSVIEMCHKRDIEATTDLLVRFVENAHRESFAP